MSSHYHFGTTHNSVVNTTEESACAGSSWGGTDFAPERAGEKGSNTYWEGGGAAAMLSAFLKYIGLFAERCPGTCFVVY